MNATVSATAACLGIASVERDLAGRATVARQCRANGVSYLPDGRRTFEPGHTVSLKHGAWAERLIGPRAAELAPLVEQLVAGTPAEAPMFALARVALARRWAILERVGAYVDAADSLIDEEGKPLPAVALEGKLLGGLARDLDALGLTPRSAAALGVDLTRALVEADKVGALDEGRRLREAAEARQAQATPGQAQALPAPNGPATGLPTPDDPTGA